MFLFTVHTVLLCLLRSINMMLDTIQTTLKLAIWALLDVVKRYGIDANKALCRVDSSVLGDSSSGNSGHSCCRYVYTLWRYQFFPQRAHMYFKSK